MLGVNPFNQPGVESYKKNMFALLGKPGYEAQKAELEGETSLITPDGVKIKGGYSYDSIDCWWQRLRQTKR